MQPIKYFGGHMAWLDPDTDPESIEPTLAQAESKSGPAPGALSLAFNFEISTALAKAAAEALELHPWVNLHVLLGRDADLNAQHMSAFRGIQHLSYTAFRSSDVSWLSDFGNLRSLYLGESLSAKRSLRFLSGTPHLESFGFSDGFHDFEMLLSLRRLRSFGMRTPKLKSLEAISGHPTIESFSMDFGGIRELSPLGSWPRLRGLELYQIRLLATEDLDAIGDCESLEVVSLGALRNVTSLRSLAAGSRGSLRYLMLEGLQGLRTLADLRNCDQLEELHMVESFPQDADLSEVLNAPSLKYVYAQGKFPPEQLSRVETAFSKSRLGREPRVSLRGSVGRILKQIDADASDNS